MEAWTAWARGPAFWAALTFMVLGLLRLICLTAWEFGRVLHRAGDKTLPWKQLCRATLRWLFPAKQLRNRPLFSLVTLTLHAGILLVPLFLAGHLALWRRGTGLAWPTLPNAVADILTVAVVVAAVAAVVLRATARETRALSRPRDYLLPLVVALPFASGFLLMHPAANPFSFEAVMLVHALGADLLLVLIPLTKLSHAVLLPATQFISEAAWRFPPEAGYRVGIELGKENEPI